MDKPRDPATKPNDGKPSDKKADETLDDALDDSFPASDPPSITDPHRSTVKKNPADELNKQKS